MKATNLELTPEAMLQMGESAVKAVVDHIINLPSAPRLKTKSLGQEKLFTKSSSKQKGRSGGPCP